MYRRPTLAKRIAELRRVYTGESDSTLIPAAQAALAALDTAHRGDVMDILDSDFGARLLGDPNPTVGPVIRSAVLLDTAVYRQQELETALLLALGRVHTYHGHGSALPQRVVCRMVCPTATGLILQMSTQTLAVLLAELLPRDHDGHLVGLAGLRWRLHRRHLELVLADADPTVHVAVASTSYRQFAAALAFATTAGGFAADPHDAPAPLSELEQVAIALDRSPGPVALASALLRRFGLFRMASWISIEPIGSTCLRIAWAGGSTPAQVAAMLTHPVAGLPDDQFSATSHPDGTIILSCAGLGGTVSLRQHAASLPRPNTASAWTAFHQMITAPNPTRTTSEAVQPA